MSDVARYPKKDDRYVTDDWSAVRVDVERMGRSRTVMTKGSRRCLGFLVRFLEGIKKLQRVPPYRWMRSFD